MFISGGDRPMAIDPKRRIRGERCGPFGFADGGNVVHGARLCLVTFNGMRRLRAA
jgi:hypothetical protein